MYGRLSCQLYEILGFNSSTLFRMFIFFLYISARISNTSHYFNCFMLQMLLI